MKVYITGTPLEALGWQRDLSRTRIVFRPETDFSTKAQFLSDLISSAKDLRHELIDAEIERRKSPADTQSA